MEISHMTPEELMQDPDWESAWPVSGAERIVPMTEVAEVLAHADGENDGADWIGIFRLKDGRFLYVSAWCDYTGWGCQDGGQAFACATIERLCADHVTDADRDRFEPKGPWSWSLSSSPEKEGKP